jgi:imidazoleglycerol-phosphate dehydratase
MMASKRNPGIRAGRKPRLKPEVEPAAARPEVVARAGAVERKTRETAVKVALKLDGEGHGQISTGVPFLDHMLQSFTRHGFFDLRIEATGDLAVDEHHTVEDVGIVLGRAFYEALGDRRGIKRFGEATVPLDEALCSVVVDISGRPYLAYKLPISQERVGAFQTALVHDFMKALADNAAMNLHVTLHAGRNPHHIIEAAFKALGRAMDQATSLESRSAGVLSTKGTLSG